MIVRTAVLIATLAAFTSSASAKTCEQMAQACTKQGGAPASCFDESRMKRCKSTGTYTAPNGTAYLTDKK